MFGAGQEVYKSFFRGEKRVSGAAVNNSGESEPKGAVNSKKKSSREMLKSSGELRVW